MIVGSSGVLELREVYRICSSKMDKSRSKVLGSLSGELLTEEAEASGGGVKTLRANQVVEGTVV